MRIVAAVSVLALFGTFAFSQKTPHPNSSIQAQQAIDSLIGMVLYACQPDQVLYGSPKNSSELFLRGYFDAETQDGIQIQNGAPLTYRNAVQYFPSGSALVIQGAEEEQSAISSISATISLNVLNQKNNVSAGIKLTLPTKGLTPTRVWSSLSSLYGSLYSFHPLPTFPRIGLTDADVRCLLGSPDHVNTDELSGEQWVYYAGKVYVYIGKNGRVTNVQTSF
jgi:hypothetical protein